MFGMLRRCLTATDGTPPSLTEARRASDGTAKRMQEAGCTEAQGRAVEEAVAHMIVAAANMAEARNAIFRTFSPACAERVLKEIWDGANIGA